MFIPDPFFSIPDPGSRVKKIPDPRAGLKNLSILTQKDVSKLSEVWSGMFILDPDVDFIYLRNQGWKRHQIPDPQHCLFSLPDAMEYGLKM